VLPDGPRVSTPAPRGAWSSILESSDEATPYHAPEWLDAACETGPFEDASRLYERPDGRQLVLPMLRRMNPVPGMSSNWSMPPGWGFGGIISAGRVATSDVACVLPDIVGATAARTIIKPGPLTRRAWDAAPGRSMVPHVVHVVDLSSGFAEIWSKRFSSDTRNKVRKAEKRGVEIEWDTTGRLLPVHYELYLRWARRRARESGLPLFLALRLAKRREPFAVAEAVARRFAARCRVGVAWTANEAAASLIALRNGAHTIFWRSASDRERTRRTFATYLLLARALEEAACSGCEHFHMGESGGVESLMRFKEHFGAARYQYQEHRFEHPVAASSVRLRERAGHQSTRLASSVARLRHRAAR
jgi:hypothetical protein